MPTADPQSFPLHADRQGSGPESRHGEAVKSNLPARPSQSAHGEREREGKDPDSLSYCTYFGAVPLFLFLQLNTARPNSSAWRREPSVLELARAGGALSASHLLALAAGDVVNHPDSAYSVRMDRQKDRERNDPLSPPHSTICISVAQNLSSLSLTFSMSRDLSAFLFQPQLQPSRPPLPCCHPFPP